MERVPCSACFRCCAAVAEKGLADLHVLEQAVRDVAVQIDLLPDAAVGCGNDKGLAIVDIGDMAQEGSVQDGMHCFPVMFSPCCAAFYHVLAVTAY